MVRLPYIGQPMWNGYNIASADQCGTGTIQPRLTCVEWVQSPSVGWPMWYGCNSLKGVNEEHLMHTALSSQGPGHVSMHTEVRGQTPFDLVPLGESCHQ
jgi:hypothetical protein